jgi:hypothetical protein
VCIYVACSDVQWLVCVYYVCVIIYCCEFTTVYVSYIFTTVYVSYIFTTVYVSSFITVIVVYSDVQWLGYACVGGGHRVYVVCSVVKCSASEREGEQMRAGTLQYQCASTSQTLNINPSTPNPKPQTPNPKHYTQKP